MNKIVALALAGLVSSAQAYIAPLEIANQSAVTTPQAEQTSIPTPPRNQLELLNQISELQGQVQALNGQLEEQGHQIASLTSQLQRFYKDLDMRLQHAQTPAATPVATTAPTTTTPPPSNGEDAQAYNRAFQSLQQRNYPQATKLLKNFTEQFQSSQYLPNAYYWLGQLYLMQGQTTDAEVMLSHIVTKFPQHQKTPDALLKLSKIATQGQDTAKARSLLQQITTRFPNSPAAQVAHVQLRQLG